MQSRPPLWPQCACDKATEMSVGGTIQVGMFRGDTQNWAKAKPFRLRKDEEKEWEEGAVFSETPDTPSRRLGLTVIFTLPSRPGGLDGTDRPS